MNIIIQGDCRETMRRWAAEGVRAQTCVTSPPYWGLRDYGVAGQLGLEATPEEYVAAMVDVFRCVRDVLADDGTLWLNLGDSYAGNKNDSAWMGGRGVGEPRKGRFVPDGIKPKDLVGIPWRVAFALQADGWYLRSDIIWHKPNPMPESVTDRPTKAHEYLFLLSKRERYYYDAGAIKEASIDPEGSAARYESAFGGEKARAPVGEAGIDTRTRPQGMREFDGMRNRRTVWTVATQPYSGAHFATFPPALIEPCILAGASQRGHCPKCYARWTRVTERPKPPKVDARDARMPGEGYERTRKVGQAYQNWLNENPKQTIGWVATCQCGVEPVADIVLDPFMGSGTTAQVAQQLGRQYIGCELNPAYMALQHERTRQTAMAI